MDNVTHSLAGLVLAESVVQLRRGRGHPPSSAFRPIAGTVGVVTANLPDADLLYAGPLMGGGKLGYLLHHRGHTHTIVAALLGAVLAWIVARAWWRAREAAPTRGHGSWLLALCAAGTLSHLVLDWTNSYGVHPFWPVDDRWFYGDAVFILEPWLWIAAIPPLLFAARRVGTRVALGGVLLALLALAWGMAMVPAGVAAMLTAGAALALLLAWRLGARGRVALMLGAWLAVEGVFFVAGGAARRSLGGPGVTDIALTPAVANPACVAAFVVAIEGPSYVVRTATVAPFASLHPVTSCARGTGGSPLVPATRGATRTVRWEYEWRAPRAELVALARDNCVAAAALRFIRVPVWSTVDASTVRIADLRYARGAGGFAEIVAPARPTTCPAHVPPWVPPAAALLAP